MSSTTTSKSTTIEKLPDATGVTSNATNVKDVHDVSSDNENLIDDNKTEMGSSKPAIDANSEVDIVNGITNNLPITTTPSSTSTTRNTSTTTKSTAATKTAKCNTESEFPKGNGTQKPVRATEQTYADDDEANDDETNGDEEEVCI